MSRAPPSHPPSCTADDGRHTMPGVTLDDAVSQVRAALPGCRLIYLFGSRATGDENAGSDVDLAVLADQPIDSLARWRLQEDLASGFGRDVDLVDLWQASTVLRARIVETGRVLYERQQSDRHQFEATALAAYARLNEERRGILEDIRRRGSVHG